MNPLFRAYLLNIGVLTGILAGIALVYMLLLGGLASLAHHWLNKGIRRSLLLSIALCLAVVVVVMPLFIGVVGLLRYDQPTGIFFGNILQREGWQVYASVTRVVFFVLFGLLVVLGGMVGYISAGRGNKRITATIITSVAQFIYLTITMWFVDFFGACIIGAPFFLAVSC